MSRHECRCKKHEAWKVEQEEKSVTVYNVKKSKAVPKAVKEFLRTNNFLSKGDAFLCSGCVSAVRKKLNLHVKKGKPTSLERPIFNKDRFEESVIL